MCIYSFFNLGITWGGGLVNATSWALYPAERAGTHCTGGRMGPTRSGRVLSIPHPQVFHHRAFQPVLSRCTDSCLGPLQSCNVGYFFDDRLCLSPVSVGRSRGLYVSYPIIGHVIRNVISVSAKSVSGMDSVLSRSVFPYIKKKIGPQSAAQREPGLIWEIHSHSVNNVKYVVRSKSFRPDQLFKVTNKITLLFFNIVSLYFNTLFKCYINLQEPYVPYIGRA